MPNRTDGHSALLDAVRALAPQISEQAPETERNRGVSPELMGKLREAGLFRMMIPRDFGGEELDQLQACRVIEELGRADGSAGWNAMVIFGFNIAISKFPRDTIEKVLTDKGDVVIRGALAPLGSARPEKGGYVMSGQWPFASGSYKPDWMFTSGIVKGADGKPRMTPQGTPEIRMAILPAKDAEILDTWYTVGLAGSSSHDFVVRDVFVPESFTSNLFDPTVTSGFDLDLMRLPFPAITGPTHSAVLIGIAQGALDELSEIAKTKRSAFNPTVRLAEDPVARHTLGELGVRLNMLRAAMDDQVISTMAVARSGQQLDPKAFAAGKALVSYTHHECVNIINQAFGLAGTTPVYSKCSLQRRWRDARVGTQHAGASVSAYQTYGALMMGEDPAPGGKG